MKIVFFELENWEQKFFEEELKDHEVTFFEEKLTGENINLAKEADVISIFIYSNLNKNILEALPKLKLICTRSTGFDHIDIDYCKKKEINVANVPSYGANSVAEHTFSLILAISRKILKSSERTKRGNFEQTDLEGFDLNGKTLGVIGAGKIGKKVVEIGKAFGMKVLIFTKRPNPNIRSVEDVNLHELLGRSDIITLHVPHNEETHHMINSKNLNQIKKGAILINTARGGIVETQAIVDGLEKGIFSAAGLDVLEEEYNLREEKELLTAEFLKSHDLKVQLLNHVLLNQENVIITPHNAFNSKESLEQILKITAENILSFIEGKILNKVV